MRLSPKLLLLSGALCAAGLLPGCDGNPAQPPSQSAKPAPMRTTPPPVARPPADTASYVFDVSALVNLTADQIKAKLGKPLSDGQESINEQMHTLSYQRQGYKLLIDYEVKARRVIDIHFFPVDNSWQDYATLLGETNIVRDEDLHLVHAMNEKDGLYEGISITPDSSRVLDRFGHWVIMR